MTEIDETKPTRVQYFKQVLPGNREVWMGYNADQNEDRGYFFKFLRDGVVTRLRLSEEALAVVLCLKPTVDMHRDVGEVVRWVQVSDQPPTDQPEQA